MIKEVEVFYGTGQLFETKNKELINIGSIYPDINVSINRYGSSMGEGEIEIKSLVNLKFKGDIYIVPVKEIYTVEQVSPETIKQTMDKFEKQVRKLRTDVDPTLPIDIIFYKQKKGYHK